MEGFRPARATHHEKIVTAFSRLLLWHIVAFAAMASASPRVMNTVRPAPHPPLAGRRP